MAFKVTYQGSAYDEAKEETVQAEGLREAGEWIIFFNRDPGGGAQVEVLRVRSSDVKRIEQAQ